MRTHSEVICWAAAAVALVGSGCEGACATNDYWAEIYKLPICPSGGDRNGGESDAGPPQGAAAPQGTAWRARNGRIAEPDHTEARVEGPDAPGVSGVLPPPPGVEGRPATAAVFRTVVDGEGCVEGHDPEAGRFHTYYDLDDQGERVIQWFRTACHLKARNADMLALADEYIARKFACARDAGFDVELDGDGSATYHYAGEDAAVVVAQDTFYACLAQNCAELNTFDAEDRDADGLNDTCDCREQDEEEARCLTQAVATGPYLPGFKQCLPGQLERTCVATDRWPDWQSFIVEQVFGGPLNQGAGLAEDLGPELEYTFEDELRGCPPGVMCHAQSSRQRGRDYEHWLCRRQKRRNPGSQCNNGRGSPSASHYRTAAGSWELPPQLGHPNARRLVLTEGRLRYPDYKIPPTRKNHYSQVLGEAKCYNPFIPWTRNATSWFSAAATGTQMQDYISKMFEGRRSGRGVAIVYHLCDLSPQWLSYMIAEALAQTAANGISFHIRDTPPAANWIKAPACYIDVLDDLVVHAPELFQCFVPGAAAPDGVDPTDSCIGAFYDFCSGSE